jgi:menaquinone-specific isochorismate synthase
LNNYKGKIERLFKDYPGKKYLSVAHKIEQFHLTSLLNYAQSNNSKYFFWNKPEEDFAFLAFSEFKAIRENGNQRIDLSEKQIIELNEKFATNWEEYGLESVPIFVGGMKFSSSDTETLWKDYTDSDWFIPEFIFLKRGNDFYLIHQIDKEKKSLDDYTQDAVDVLSTTEQDVKFPEEGDVVIEESNIGDQNEKTNWKYIVNQALDEIENSTIQKIVLSRRVELKLNKTPNISELLSELSRKYPRCYIFAYRSNDSTFFGATPEKLAKISNSLIEADALAGSISRGSTKEEDENLAEELLSSKKNLTEQKAVVEFIVSSFNGITENIDYPEKPIIRKLENIQHLWTPIKAKMKTEKAIFSILKEIHPTPAICGVPWSAALTYIKEMENHTRGLFAGIVGWFNFESEGDFAVSIRSALLKDNSLYAFAGCGIVEGSDPEAEYEETELKLKPILSLFKDETIYQP